VTDPLWPALVPSWDEQATAPAEASAVIPAGAAAGVPDGINRTSLKSVGCDRLPMTADAIRHRANDDPLAIVPQNLRSA